MKLFFFSDCLTWQWTRKFIYSPFENHICKSAFFSLCIQRQVNEWGVEGKNATQCLLDVSFIRFPSKCIRDTWNRNNAPEGLQNHISIAAMAFKCHARLDTCVIITLRAQPCTFRHKHRSQLCFVGSNALRSQQKSPSVIRKKKPPGGLSSHCTPPPMQSSDPHLFSSLSSLPFPPGKWFEEGRIMRSQTPVIWQRITQMGQTEPAEPTGSWEWWCTGCFLSTGCAVAQKLHRLTHQTEPLKEGPQRDQRGQGEQKWEQPDQEEGPQSALNEWRVEIGK